MEIMLKGMHDFENPLTVITIFDEYYASLQDVRMGLKKRSK